MSEVMTPKIVYRVDEPVELVLLAGGQVAAQANDIVRVFADYAVWTPSNGGPVLNVRKPSSQLTAKMTPQQPARLDVGHGFPG